MLKNEPTLAIVAVHTAENEPLKILEVIHFNFQFGPYAQGVLDAVRLGVPTIPPMTRQPLTAWLPQYVVVEHVRCLISPDQNTVKRC